MYEKNNNNKYKTFNQYATYDKLTQVYRFINDSNNFSKI